MELFFLANGNEKAYTKYIPNLQKIIRFKNSGEMQEVPDDLAKELMHDFPRMFGTSIESIEKIQGKQITEKPSIKEKDSKEHPTVKAFKNIEKMIVKTDGHLEKIDRKPIKKIIKRKVTK